MEAASPPRAKAGKAQEETTAGFPFPLSPLPIRFPQAPSSAGAVSRCPLIRTGGFLRSALKRLRRLRQRLSPKVKGSSNRQKPGYGLPRPCHGDRSTVGLLPSSVPDSSVRTPTVMLEDLNVSGMVKNRKPARSLADADWRLLRTFFPRLSHTVGRWWLSMDRWLPTSQTCSACGHRDGAKPLSVCTRTCSACSPASGREAEARPNQPESGGAAMCRSREVPARRGGEDVNEQTGGCKKWLPGLDSNQ